MCVPSRGMPAGALKAGVSATAKLVKGEMEGKEFGRNVASVVGSGNAATLGTAAGTILASAVALPAAPVVAVTALVAGIGGSRLGEALYDWWNS